MAVGSLLFGIAADRIVQRGALIWSLAVFGLFTLGKSLAGSYAALVSLQFLAGLGLGGAYPNAIALMVEYAPKRVRNTLVTAGACGYLFGSSIGGFLATTLIPRFGWPSVFVIGGAVPLALVGLLALYLPESIPHLIGRAGGEAEARRILHRIAPDLALPSDVALGTSEMRPSGFSVLALFRQGRAAATLLLWVTQFMNLAVAFFVFSWLPTIFRTAGISLRYSVLAATTLPLGAMLGSLLWGRLIDRFSRPAVLAAACVLYAVFLAPVGSATGSLPQLMLLLFFAGVGNGSQTAINSFIGTTYPTAIRSTGLGWAIGIGRVGSMLGPIAGAAMIGWQWSQPAIFYAAALPCLIAALSIYLVGFLVVPTSKLMKAMAGQG